MGGNSLVEAEVWTAEWWLLQDRVAPLFRRADLRKRARDYVRGLLGSVGRKNCWQLAEFAGQKSPGSMQSMLARGSWDADAVRDVIVDYVGERLGPGGVLIVDLCRGGNYAERGHLIASFV